MEVEEDYNHQVTSLLIQYQAEEAALRDTDKLNGIQEKISYYDEDIHYPVLLTLRLKKQNDIG